MVFQKKKKTQNSIYTDEIDPKPITFYDLRFVSDLPPQGTTLASHWPDDAVTLHWVDEHFTTAHYMDGKMNPPVNESWQ